MKKIISLAMSVLMILSLAGTSFASEKKFDLIEYLESNKVESHAELMDVLSQTSGYPLESMQTYSQKTFDEENEILFDYSIDYENNVVEVDTVYLTAQTNSTKSASAYHETYSTSGYLMYTVRVNGTFSYNSTSCTTTSKSGSFTKGTGSLWSSTPSITSGRISSTKAYARISGEAKLLFDKSSYCLTLMCDNTGKITNSFSRP